ncbi:MAG: hypothetical protein HN712_29690 [Gemmatimonadetes bacterium]|nr:hypothetical protein [Gemmatimonadota bacterium]
MMKSIAVTTKAPAPSWAIKQRQLLDQMGDAAQEFRARYVHRGGTLRRHGKLDDDYEAFTSWPLAYCMGGDERLLDWSLESWNGITRQWTYQHQGSVDREFVRSYDMLHLSEGYVGLQNFALADPSIPENADRALRFARFYTGDDPGVDNYDKQHRLIRSPITGSDGPAFSSGATYVLNYGHASLHPVLDLEPGWDQDETRLAEVQRLYDEVVIQGDVPINMAICGLVTHAHILTGDARCREWVLEYVDAWIERTRLNGGIIPDNVGRSGRIGETREGQWWGGFFGWSGRYSVWMMFHALSTAVECCWLLTRDPKYLAFYRSQVDYLLDRAIERDGDLLVPYKMGPSGWHDFRPLDPYVVGHLWHLSMAESDRTCLERLHSGAAHGPHAYAYADSPHAPEPGAEEWRPDGPAEWNRVWDDLSGNKLVENEPAHLRWLAGDNPDWPDRILDMTAIQIQRAVERLQGDYEHEWASQTVTAQNPVMAAGLGQMVMGAPFQGFNGGLLVARLRYFDAQHRRPGMPRGVAALIEKLAADQTIVQLVNTNPSQEARVLVQAGAYGEHRFITASWQDADGLKTQDVAGRCLEVVLAPGAVTRLDLKMDCYVNDPTYAMPWEENDDT